MRGATFDPTQNKALLSELDILKEFKKLWADELMRAAENRDAVGSYTESQVIKLSEKETGKDSIKTQLRSNLDNLRDMSPVATVDYESIKHLNRAEKAKVIMEGYNKKFKGGIERKNFGFIVLTEKEVVGSLKYLYTDGEYAAFNVLLKY